MSHLPFSERATVRRVARRADYDPAVIARILDEGLVAHAAFVHDGHPFVVPMAYVRVGAEVMVHGAVASRFLKTAGLPMSLSVTIIDGLVYAKSAFHHSVNYRSVVILGTAREVTDEREKRAFLDALVERVSPGRTHLVRAPNDKELAATRVLALPLAEASAKIRTGGPIDDEEDLTLDVWSGHLPIALAASTPVSIEIDKHRRVIAGSEIPEHLRAPRFGG
jgi:nitroimidazol reductase NimA-like FMN-containing flavoprotein (pyridoxamine 5'-phosphate oxidase superfamily)